MFAGVFQLQRCKIVIFPQWRFLSFLLEIPAFPSGFSFILFLKCFFSYCLGDIYFQAYLCSLSMMDTDIHLFSSGGKKALSLKRDLLISPLERKVKASLQRENKKHSPKLTWYESWKCLHVFHTLHFSKHWATAPQSVPCTPLCPFGYVTLRHYSLNSVYDWITRRNL